MTAPESRAPREGRTGEARCGNPKCGHVENYHTAGNGCVGSFWRNGAVIGCPCVSYQPPSPPSVGDATPEAEVVGVWLDEHGAASGLAYAPSAPPAALPPIPEGHPHAHALTAIQYRVGVALRAASFTGPTLRADNLDVARRLAASYAALLASPSVVADAGAGTLTIRGEQYERDADGLWWYTRERLPYSTGARWGDVLDEVTRLTSALDAATRRAEAAAEATMQASRHMVGLTGAIERGEARVGLLNYASHVDRWISEAGAALATTTPEGHR